MNKSACSGSSVSFRMERTIETTPDGGVVAKFVIVSVSMDDKGNKLGESLVAEVYEVPVAVFVTMFGPLVNAMTNIVRTADALGIDNLANAMIAGDKAATDRALAGVTQAITAVTDLASVFKQFIAQSENVSNDTLKKAREAHEKSKLSVVSGGRIVQ